MIRLLSTASLLSLLSLPGFAQEECPKELVAFAQEHSGTWDLASREAETRRSLLEKYFGPGGLMTSPAFHWALQDAFFPGTDYAFDDRYSIAGSFWFDRRSDGFYAGNLVRDNRYAATALWTKLNRAFNDEDVRNAKSGYQAKKALDDYNNRLERTGFSESQYLEAIALLESLDEDEAVGILQDYLPTYGAALLHERNSSFRLRLHYPFAVKGAFNALAAAFTIAGAMASVAAAATGDGFVPLIAFGTIMTSLTAARHLLPPLWHRKKARLLRTALEEQFATETSLPSAPPLALPHPTRPAPALAALPSPGQTREPAASGVSQGPVYTSQAAAYESLRAHWTESDSALIFGTDLQRAVSELGSALARAQLAVFSRTPWAQALRALEEIEPKKRGKKGLSRREATSALNEGLFAAVQAADSVLPSFALMREDSHVLEEKLELAVTTLRESLQRHVAEVGTAQSQTRIFEMNARLQTLQTSLQVLGRVQESITATQQSVLQSRALATALSELLLISQSQGPSETPWSPEEREHLRTVRAFIKSLPADG